jgi:hypothetical protein
MTNAMAKNMFVIDYLTNAMVRETNQLILITNVAFYRVIKNSFVLVQGYNIVVCLAAYRLLPCYHYISVLQKAVESPHC